MEQSEEQAPPPKGPHRGARRAVLIMLGGILILSFMDVLIKYLTRDVGTAQLMWVRFTLQGVFLTLIAGASGIRERLTSRRPELHVLRSVLQLTGSFTFILSLAYLTLAEANAISFASPLMLAAMSRIFLGERASADRIIAIAIGFVGVLIVIRPASGVFQWAALLPLVTAVTIAGSHILTPIIARTEDPSKALYYQAYITAVGFGLVMPWLWVDLSALSWGLLVLVAAMGTIGHFAMIRAFQHAPPSLLSPMLYLHLLWAIAFGWGFFGEVPDFPMLLGSAIIVASGLYVYFRR